jgi:Holliday junction resolvase
MPNKNYIKGYNFERNLAIALRRKGFFVVRAGGSKGPADLVAVRKNEPARLIQCKVGDACVSAVERNELYLAAIEAGAIAITACKKDRELTVYRRLTGLATENLRSQVIIKNI